VQHQIITKVVDSHHWMVSCPITWNKSSTSMVSRTHHTYIYINPDITCRSSPRRRLFEGFTFRMVETKLYQFGQRPHHFVLNNLFMCLAKSLVRSLRQGWMICIRVLMCCPRYHSFLKHDEQQVHFVWVSTSFICLTYTGASLRPERLIWDRKWSIYQCKNDRHNDM